VNVSVIGLGKLGSPMVACFAAKGHRVIGVDVNESFVQKINAGIAPVIEPGLQEMLDRSGGRLTATSDVRAAVLASDLTFVIVPTPSDETGGFSLKYALTAAESVGRALAEKPNFHIVVLTSTVLPGGTDGPFRQTLEAASGKKVTVDFGLCYSPEFISLGSVIRDFLNPDFLLIGESDPYTGQTLVDFYKTVVDNTPKIARMSAVNAELTKIAVNTYVTTKISYANMLAEICERLPGGDVDQVTQALGMDTRIGPKYLKGSIGFGGPCFPRDNRALASLAESLGVGAHIPHATDTVNLAQVTRLRELVQSYLPAGGTVGVLGLAYKPHTPVVERAQGLELAQALLAAGVPTVVYDPLAMPTAKPFLHGPVRFAESVADCARSVDVLIVCTAWPEFKELNALDLSHFGHKRVVIDCWRMLDPLTVSITAHYVAIGRDLTSQRVQPSLRKAG
jgi:UDPglucose 6-dehydrogenase